MKRTLLLIGCAIATWLGQLMLTPSNTTVLTLKPHLPMAQYLFTGFNKGSGGANLFYGNGCTATSNNSTCTVGGTQQTGLNTFYIGYPITTGSNGAGYSVVKCGVNFGVVDGTNKGAECGIYDGNGGSAALVCNNTSGITATTGWNESTLTGCGTLSASHVYTITWQVQGSGTGYLHNSVSTNAFDGTATYGTWASSVTYQTGSDYSIYIVLTAN